MFKDWNEHTALVKKSFGEMGKKHPKMLQAYGALEQAAAAEALDAKTRELIAIASHSAPQSEAHRLFPRHKKNRDRNCQ